jgi:type I restriction enzyme S subunit
MSAATWKTLPFESAVHSRGSGNSGLPTKEWLPDGQFPVIGQGAEDIEGWTDREDLLLTPTPAVVLYGGHTRRAKHVSQPFVPGPNVKILQPVPAVDSKFLFYFLTQLPVESRGYADHFPLVRKCDVPVPPLAEQQRIAGLLDEAFEGLATAQANAEKNLQSSRDLLESHLRFVFKQRGKRWMEKPLGVICDFSQGIQVDVKLQSETEKNQSQVRFLRIVDFTQGNESMRYIDNPGKKFLVCQSDISLVRYGASTGFVCRGLEGAIANNLFRVIPKDGQVSNEFLYWFLKSPAFQDEIKKIMNGAAMPAISFGVINEIEVAFPPQQEQPEIVSMLDAFAEETQRLARLSERKHAALEALKKSLLHQAFTGEL